jgi:hypothetical protein
MSYYQFSNEHGETFGSCEVFQWDRFDCEDAGLIERDIQSATGWVSFDFGMGGTIREDTDPTLWEGWYWQACFPGCLPDGDPMGPYASEADCMEAAQVAA